MFDSKWTDDNKEAPPGINETSRKGVTELISKTGVNS